MILYRPGLLGCYNLTRLHGSAVYKVLLPVLFSTCVLLIFASYTFQDGTLRTNKAVINEDNSILHPYAIGAFIGFFSFLLTFRLNFAYNRYWEATSACFQMQSKWLDCAMSMAAFHYQSDQYADIYPRTFGNYPNLDPKRIRGRDRHHETTWVQSLHNITQAVVEQETIDNLHKPKRKFAFRKRSSSNPVLLRERQLVRKSINSVAATQGPADLSSRIPIPQRFQNQFKLSASATAPELSVPPDSISSSNITNRRRPSLMKQSHASLNVVSEARTPLPSLFLQETAHLVSLLSAVAFSTLRNDVEETEMPMTEYEPGMPWPPEDPDELGHEIQAKYGEEQPLWRWINFILGVSRSQRHRTLYNAARPMSVLGGVSDQEMQLLEDARGPYAKMALCTMWLQEFLSREYLNGSTGAVGSPIISRLYQFISDGVVGYNQARKVSYVPFPFPHAQVTSFFCMVILFFFPILYYIFVNRLWVSCVLNAAALACFLGIHEVARELEKPFKNVPNDLPLTTWQAQFNEALVCMYAGYPPDSWWQVVPAEATVASSSDSSEDHKTD